MNWMHAINEELPALISNYLHQQLRLAGTISVDVRFLGNSELYIELSQPGAHTCIACNASLTHDQVTHAYFQDSAGGSIESYSTLDTTIMLDLMMRFLDALAYESADTVCHQFETYIQHLEHERTLS